MGWAGWMEHSHAMINPDRSTERIMDPNEPSVQTMMVSGKGNLAGSDLFTPGVFDEVLPLYLHFLDLSVETSAGNTFRGWDLCSQPSVPGMEHGTPCMISSPFHCFSEYTEALDPRHRDLDATYHSRPSFRTMNASAMKAEASILRGAGSRGCSWWTTNITLSADIWSGGSVIWNQLKTLIERVPTLMVDFQVEHPSKLSQLGDIADVSEAIRLHALQWQKDVQEFSARSMIVEVASADAATFEDVSDEVFKKEWGLISVGLVALVVVTVTALWNPKFVLESRSQLGFRCLILVLIGTMSNLHPYYSVPTPSFFFFVDNYANEPWKRITTTQERHFVDGALVIHLVMCFAVMDVFVWIHHFSKLGLRYIEETDFPEILEKVFESAGRTILLSMCFRLICIEAVLFNLAYGTVADATFRLRSMMMANLVLQFGQFPYLIVREAQRIKAGVREYSAPSKPSAEAVADLSRPCNQNKKFEQFGGFLMRLEVKLALVASSAAFTYCSYFLMEPKGTGYSLSDITSTENSERHRTMEMFDNQGAFPVSLLFFNASLESDGQAMQTLYEDVSSTVRTRPSPFGLNLKNLTWSPPFSDVDLQTYTDVTQSYSMQFVNMTTMGVPGVCGGHGDPAVSFEYYNRWPALLRKGYHEASYTECEGEQCKRYHLRNFDDRKSHLWNRTFEEPYIVEHVRPVRMDDRKPMDQDVLYYQFYMTGAVEDENIMRAVESVLDVLDVSSLKDVYACGPTFTQYAGLRDLRFKLITSGKAIVGFQFLLGWMLLGFRLATASVCSSTMMLMQIWGLVMSQVKLNVFSAVSMMMVGSLVPLFITNLSVCSRGNAELPPAQRLGVAMADSLPGTVQGSLCILCAFSALLLSPSPLMVQYFAVPSIITVLLGLVHGCIFAPALLALVAQNEAVPVKSMEDSGFVGNAVEVGALQRGPNLLESSVHVELDKSK